MSEFIWQDDYLLDNKQVDQQHKQLFDLANQLVKSSRKEDLIDNAMQLYKHVREHFQAEEALMKQHSYPAYAEHVQAHNQLLNNLVEISDHIHQGKWQHEEVRLFMRGWVLVHILDVDSLLGNFLRQQ